MIRCRVFGHDWISGWSPSRNSAGLRCLRCGAERWFDGPGRKVVGWRAVKIVRAADLRRRTLGAALALAAAAGTAFALFGCIVPDTVELGILSGQVDGATSVDEDLDLDSAFDVDAILVSFGWSPTMRRIERRSEEELELLRRLVEARAER